MIEIKGAHLTGTVIEGNEVPNVIDEIPVLAVAGAIAEGARSFEMPRNFVSKRRIASRPLRQTSAPWAWKCTRSRMG